MTDTLPTGFSFAPTPLDTTASTASVTCAAPSGQTITCTIPAAALPAGATATVVLRARADASTAPDPGAGYPNLAVLDHPDDPAPPDPTCRQVAPTLTAAAAISDSSNNVACADTPLVAQADLGIVKQVQGQDGNPDPVAVAAGQTITYTLTVTNAGPSDASGVVVTDSFPAVFIQVTLGTVTPPSLGCTLAPPGTQFVLTCDAATMAAGSTATVTLTAVVPVGLPDGAVIPNTATVAARTPQVPDALPNSDTASVEVGAVADLSVTKSVTPAETVSGGSVTYTLSVSNAGPSDAADATLSDTFPAQLQGVTVVDDGPYTCAPIVGNTLTCTIASHPVGVDATITVNATVVPGTYLDLMTVSNSATVSSQTTDPDPADNAATATFRPLDPHRSSVTKTATPGSIPEPGGDVSFAVSVTNTGNVAVSLTSLVDNVHGDVNGKGSCVVPQSLAPGATYACAFTAFVGGVGGTVETRRGHGQGRHARGSPGHRV